MRVRVDGWAWLDRRDLNPDHVPLLRQRLTVFRRKLGDFQDEAPGPLELYAESPTHFGIPRAYFFANKAQSHDIDWQVTDGAEWPGPLTFAGEPLDEQAQARKEVLRLLDAGSLGGVVQAPTGWGKTIWAALMIAALQRTTLVFVHKEFLLNQWRDRLQEFLPGVQVGVIQEDRQEIEGRHVVIAMMQTLATRGVDEGLARWPGLIIADEVHRVGAETWAPLAPAFPARFRLGLSARPKRKDGADDAFLHHIGSVIYQGKSLRLTPKVKRVRTSFQLRDDGTRSLASRSLAIRFLCANVRRNKRIVEQVHMAVEAGRKVLVLSERVDHLKTLQEMFAAGCPDAASVPGTFLYTGTEAKKIKGKVLQAELDKARVVFSTVQLVSEAFDYPPLDTLCLATPVWDAEQATGRILRPHVTKKEPIIIDIRDDGVERFEAAGANRDRFYASIGA